MRPDATPSLTVGTTARAIHTAARGELLQRLFRAALGEPEPMETHAAGWLDGMAEAVQSAVRREPRKTPFTASTPAAWADHVARAAERTGVPARILTGIINAEVGSSWNPAARNPRSSAAGLGQFLAGTWLGEARRAGSWLNARARELGLVDDAGRPAPDARERLLALRHDGATMIEALADFTRENLRRLPAGGDPLRLAYLAHHLGLADARRYLGEGLSESRALQLLSAQIGPVAAQAATARHGSASAAHRQWLEGFMARKLG